MMVHRQVARHALLIGAAIAATPFIGSAQVVAPSRAAQAPLPDDVVVEGYRQRKDRDTRLTPPVGTSAVQNRREYEYSEQLARCAARSKLSSLSRLRAVVDGAFNTSNHTLAQDRLKRTYITCSESPSLLSFTSPPQSTLGISGSVTGDLTGAAASIDPAPLGHSLYDRGAFTVQALRLFAPDLRLTRAQTVNPVVQARFNQRENPRNRARLPGDYRYFEVAVCMVRLEPELAVRLALSDGPARFSDVQEALIDRARLCVGDARRVQVDPTQFRLYIADAVYRWAVAARGVDSLIPAG